MRRAVHGNPDERVYLDGGGCVVAIGLAFSVAGAFFLVAGLTQPVTFRGGEPAGLLGTIFCTALSSLFVLFGAAITVSRSGITIDRRARTANRWWGIWKPWGAGGPHDGVPARVHVLSRPRPKAITDRAEVAIGRKVEKVGSQDRERVVYPVRLDCPPSFLIAECTDELEARHVAEEIARFLGLAVVDGASGTKVRREAETLGQPLAERARRLGLPTSLPPAPAGMSLTYQVEDERLTFTAPPEPFDPFLLAYLVSPVLFSLGVWYFLYQGKSLDELKAGQRAPVDRTMVLVLGLPLVFGLIGFGSAIYWGGSLAVTAEGLRVRRRGWPFGSIFLPVAELDEVRVGKAGSAWRVSVGGFHVRSDPDAEILELQLFGKKRIARFGRGRSHLELEWVRGVILQAIAG